MTMAGLLLAVALQAAWMPTKAPPADSVSAASIYVEACLQGKLKLTPERGRMLSEREGTSFRNYFNWVGSPSRVRIIKFNQPRDTYLFLVDFKDAPARKIERTCILSSPQLNVKDARNAFMVGTEATRPRVWNWNRYYPDWELDEPKLGFRKFLRVRDNRTIELEFSSYAPAPASK